MAIKRDSKNFTLQDFLGNKRPGFAPSSHDSMLLYQRR